jgi:palmitoyl-protein thioesterase
MYNKISILITLLFIINISGKAICDNRTAKNINKKLGINLFNKIKNDKIYPVVLLHGILSDKSQFSPVKTWLNKNIPNPVYNLEIGNGKVDSIFKPMNWQIEQLCNTIYNIPELKDGFHFIGMSQGGLLARAYVEYCNEYPVINLITWVSPHGGVYGLGNLKISLERVYMASYQNMFSYSGYFKDPYRYSTYLMNSTFLPELNNELLSKSNIDISNIDRNINDRNIDIAINNNFIMRNRRENILSLENFVMIWSPNDDVLSPPESGKFGFYKILDENYYKYKKTNILQKSLKNKLDLPVVDIFESEQFTMNLLGLRTLWETRRLHILETNCTHSGHNSEECFEQLDDLTFPFLI